MGRYPKFDKPMERLHIFFEVRTIVRLKKMAKRLKQPHSQLVREAVEQYLKRAA